MTQTVALLRDIESERCEIAMLVTLMEKESWESEPVMRPNMLLRHISQERFRQFMIEMRFDEVIAFFLSSHLHYKNRQTSADRVYCLKMGSFMFLLCSFN